MQIVSIPITFEIHIDNFKKSYETQAHFSLSLRVFQKETKTVNRLIKNCLLEQIL